jgi:hypothetical protein
MLAWSENNAGDGSRTGWLWAGAAGLVTWSCDVVDAAAKKVDEGGAEELEVE